MKTMKFSLKQIIWRFCIISISTLCISFGFNMLLIPMQLLSGGMSGVAMLIGYIFNTNIGWLYLALNLPVLIWGWFALGKRFVIWSIYSVVTTTIAMQFIPVVTLSDDILLCSVFGGILVGAGSGMALRVGGSTGGFDIIATIITLKRDWPIGTILSTLNAIVIGMLIAFTKDWNLALYSLVAIFCTGKIVDVIHTKYIKVTAFIITTKTEEMLRTLLEHPRGITIIKTRGAYTSNERDMLMTVRTRYELTELIRTIKIIDENAFINVVETVGVYGEFRKLKVSDE